MITDNQVSAHYGKYQAFIQWFFYKSGANGKSEELTNDVYLAIVSNKESIEDIDKYAWGCVRNKLKMLYRSADYKAQKCQYIDDGHQISQEYDQDVLCEILDGGDNYGYTKND